MPSAILSRDYRTASYQWRAIIKCSERELRTDKQDAIRESLIQRVFIYYKLIGVYHFHQHTLDSLYINLILHIRDILKICLPIPCFGFQTFQKHMFIPQVILSLRLYLFSLCVHHFEIYFGTGQQVTEYHHCSIIRTECTFSWQLSVYLYLFI